MQAATAEALHASFVGQAKEHAQKHRKPGMTGDPSPSNQYRLDMEAFAQAWPLAMQYFQHYAAHP
jgi:hypothetical protein